MRDLVAKEALWPFVQVQIPLLNKENQEFEEYNQIVKILEDRLPISAPIYNSVKMSPRFPSQACLYYLPESGGNLPQTLSPSSWIIFIHFTEDHGQNISISASESENRLTRPQIINMLTSIPKKIFSWDEPHWFVALEKWLTPLIIEICLVKGNIIHIYPDNLLVMDNNVEIPEMSDLTVEVGKLDPLKGTEFICSTWKYATDLSKKVVQRFVENNESAGVYVEGTENPVSGILTHGYGVMGMLYTNKEYRKKGYAKMCILSVSQALRNSGMVPASSVDLWNKGSLKLHEELGFKIVEQVSWVMFSPSELQD